MTANRLTVIPAKAGRFWAAEWRHHPGTFHAFPSTPKSKEESLAKLPIACGARVTFLCSHKVTQRKCVQVQPNPATGRRKGAFAIRHPWLSAHRRTSCAAPFGASDG